jgi:hypothetical protein
MTKLCPRGKAAAKRKFDVYPSAYANAYASKICAGKIKDPSGVKRKDFRGKKAEGGLMEATARLKRQGLKNGGSPNKYPKCVPAAKAARMTDSQKRSAVSRKRAKAQGVGGKPTNVKTFARKKAAMGGYMGKMIDANLGGVNVSNPSYTKYYKGMI